MMRTLDKEVFKAFKVPPKWFTRFLLELHDVLPNERVLELTSDNTFVKPYHMELYLKPIKEFYMIKTS